VHVVAKRGAVEKMPTFRDPQLHPIQRRAIEDIYKSVVPADMTPKLKKLRETHFALYSRMDPPFGLFQFEKFNAAGTNAFSFPA
jgi:hypothetical protein